MLAVVDADTAEVLTVNVAVVLPETTVTLAGTVAALSLLDNMTVAPLVGAAAESVTVPVGLFPAATDVGARLSADSVGLALKVKIAELLPLTSEAVMLADVEADTGEVLTVNVAVVFPAATVTLAGTVATALSLESVTTVPPVGAAAASVTVPVEVLPPTTAVGLSASADTAGTGVKVRVAVLVIPL